MKKLVRNGRPPKFNEESGPITVTLPRRIVRNLEKIDRDRAKAIVKCVENVHREAWPDSDGQQVEIIQVATGMGMIVVPPSTSLASIPWLKLIEIAPCRSLLAVPSGTAPESLEIAILDLIEHLPEEQGEERAMLTDLRLKLSQHRQMEGLSKAEILLINHQGGPAKS